MCLLKCFQTRTLCLYQLLVLFAYTSDKVQIVLPVCEEVVGGSLSVAHCEDRQCHAMLVCLLDHCVCGGGGGSDSQVECLSYT